MSHHKQLCDFFWLVAWMLNVVPRTTRPAHHEPSWYDKW